MIQLGFENKEKIITNSNTKKKEYCKNLSYVPATNWSVIIYSGDVIMYNLKLAKVLRAKQF